MATAEENGRDRPELVVEDPEDQSQNKRIQQILQRRSWVMDATQDLRTDPRLTEVERKKAFFNIILNYVADLEPLKRQYPACEGFWTGREKDLADDDTELLKIGKIDYQKELPKWRSAIRSHELAGVQRSVSDTGIDILGIEPESKDIGGLNDFIELDRHQERGVQVTYQQQPNAYNTDPDEKYTVFNVHVPIWISRRALRLANLYISEIGLTATPGEEIRDAEIRYGDLLEEGPPEGDPASVRGED